MKILITGGAGFIGSNLATRLVAEGLQVVVVDNLSTGKRSNLPGGIKFYQMDIRNKALHQVLAREKPNLVSHHAAQINLRFSVEDPLYDADVNILGSLNLLEGCIKYGVQRFVFASTGGGIYGEGELPARESDPTNPLSPYGVVKLAVEKYLYFYHKVYGLPYVALRYSNVYGPKQNAQGEAGVIAIFTNKLLQGQQPTIYGNGEQTRDYVYVDDVVEANALALHTQVVGAFNVGTGRETSVNRLYEMLAHLTGTAITPIYGPEKAGELRRNVLDWKTSERVLGWVPRVRIEEGLKKTVAFFQACGEEV